MTGWVPLIKGGSTPPVEFASLARAFGRSRFQELEETMSLATCGLSDSTIRPEPKANGGTASEADTESHRAPVQQFKDKLFDVEVSALKAEIERLKQAHYDELTSVTEKTATDMATSLLVQHEAAFANLLETLAHLTAGVLRPILNGAATEAAVRDFTTIVAELLKDGSGAGFSVRISEAYHERFRKILPSDIEISPSSSGDPIIEVLARNALISSRLTEWSHSILENVTNE